MFCNRSRRQCRSGKVLVCLVVLLPALVAMLGLVLDGSLLFCESRQAQHVADAAAMAAARELQLGHSESVEAIAIEYVEQHNGLSSTETTVNVPPTEGPYAGDSNFVEVIVSRRVDTHVMRVWGPKATTVTVRSVAGFKASTAGIAVAVLDPEPPPISLAPITLALPPLTPHLAGLEVQGVGEVRIEGAVAVNTIWGGQDENGNPAGSSEGPPYGVMCTPVLPLTRLVAEDLRVVGGVDDPANYGALDSGDPSPLRANRLPIPDPYADAPVPTVSTAPDHVSATNYGGVRVVGLPLIGPPVTLNPGVYDWIEVVSGTVIFNPGIYVIRNVNPLTGIALSVLAGEVTAEGVMFYITDTTNYSVNSGAPDASDAVDNSTPPAPWGTTVKPSVVINVGLLSGSFSPLADPGGPFDGMLIFQRRNDRRPLVIVKQSLLGGTQLAGTIYAKWGHLIAACNGTLDVRIVVGSLRFADVLECTIAPGDLMPPAQDVFLVE